MESLSQASQSIRSARERRLSTGLSSSSSTADIGFEYGPKSPPIPVSTLRSPLRRFRLLDLPVELQRLVFYHYFGGPYNITLENERLTMLRSRFHVLGMPSLDLVLVSKYINAYAAPIRHSLFTGRLILNSVFILVPFRRQERFAWLRDHTRILHFSDSSVHPERWSRYFDSLAALRKLEIDFPMVIKLENFGGVDLQGVVAGREDAMLVKSLDAFRLALVDQLREGRLDVVIRQKYDVGDAGGLLEVEIKLSENGAEVLKRKFLDARNMQAPQRRPAEFVRANGNIIDAGSHRSIWEYWQEMST